MSEQTETESAESTEWKQFARVLGSYIVRKTRTKISPRILIIADNEKDRRAARRAVGLRARITYASTFDEIEGRLSFDREDDRPLKRDCEEALTRAYEHLDAKKQEMAEVRSREDISEEERERSVLKIYRELSVEGREMQEMYTTLSHLVVDRAVIERFDGILTVLSFETRAHGRDNYGNVVAREARERGVPVVVVTDSNYHHQRLKASRKYLDSIDVPLVDPFGPDCPKLGDSWGNIGHHYSGQHKPWKTAAKVLRREMAGRKRRTIKGEFIAERPNYHFG